MDFPHKIVHSCRDRAEAAERMIQENNSVWGVFLSMQNNLPWPCVCWWGSCKEPLKDASKATLTLRWWELIWDAPVWIQQTTSFRTSTGSFHRHQSTAGSVQNDSWFMSSQTHFTALLLWGRWKPSCMAGTSRSREEESSNAWDHLWRLPSEGQATACHGAAVIAQLPGCSRLCLCLSWGRGRARFYIRIWQGEGCTDAPVCLGVTMSLPVEGFLSVFLWVLWSSWWSF